MCTCVICHCAWGVCVRSLTRQPHMDNMFYNQQQQRLQYQQHLQDGSRLLTSVHNQATNTDLPPSSMHGHVRKRGHIGSNSFQQDSLLWFSPWDVSPATPASLHSSQSPPTSFCSCVFYQSRPWPSQLACQWELQAVPRAWYIQFWLFNVEHIIFFFFILVIVLLPEVDRCIWNALKLHRSFV